MKLLFYGVAPVRSMRQRRTRPRRARAKWDGIWPVMDEKMAQEKRILVPVDGSAPSVRALEFAHGLCGALGARLDVVTVLDLLRIDPFEGYGMTDAQFSELQVKIRDDILKHMRAQLGDSATQIETRLLQGKILEVLLEESDQDDVMMVVVGRTGKGFFERMIEGSVSRGLAKHASKPVLVIP